MVLHAVGIGKRYRYGVRGCGGVVRALAHASVQVARSELVGVCGPRGSGKSTLLLCCAGLLRPDAGYIAWPSRHPRRHGPPDDVALVHQEPRFARYLTVREVLDRYVYRREWPRDVPDSDRLVKTALGLARCDRTEVGDLSAGAVWRLALLVALLGRPRLLIADGVDGDATANHAPTTLRLIRLLCDGGTSALVSARDGAILHPYADRVLTLEHGHVTAGSRDPEWPVVRLGVSSGHERVPPVQHADAPQGVVHAH
ncbi:MAG TPA: ATP-binding cassette domain-containing protein [Gemmatimonadaceae bacterium]|nr:ATP-binding cassette domain-containing protein [Gemmatimonadaceae bacterium]